MISRFIQKCKGPIIVLKNCKFGDHSQISRLSIEVISKTVCSWKKVVEKLIQQNREFGNKPTNT